MIKAKGYGATGAHSKLKPMEFERQEPGANDVQIDVLYCGVCHSDVHQVENAWDNTVYPCVPGHEVVGRVTQVGARVTRHAVGDLVGVGCMVDSCRQCEPCRAQEENYCEGPNGFLGTYNGPFVPAKKSPTGKNMYGQDNTYGGYSNVVVAPEDFVLKIPTALKPEQAAPILCAGVTTYSPLKHWRVKPGDKVGIVGFGGLGHLAVKLAKAMGAEVTVFTRTEEKLDDAKRLGVTGVLEGDKKALEALKSHFDFILSTVPEKHDLNPFITLLKRNRTIVAVGALVPLEPINNMELIVHRKHTAGSLIGSIAETQEVLDFCAEHGIAPDIELIDIQDINKAFQRTADAEVRFRHVINMASLAST